VQVLGNFLTDVERAKILCIGLHGKIKQLRCRELILVRAGSHPGEEAEHFVNLRRGVGMLRLP
jgi:hypothetical protein